MSAVSNSACAFSTCSMGTRIVFTVLTPFELVDIEYMVRSPGKMFNRLPNLPGKLPGGRVSAIPNLL